eukprot:1193006-Prorocentrum_minimum.AAC.1
MFAYTSRSRRGRTVPSCAAKVHWCAAMICWCVDMVHGVRIAECHSRGAPLTAVTRIPQTGACPLWVYSLSPSVIGAPCGYILSPLP